MDGERYNGSMLSFAFLILAFNASIRRLWFCPFLQNRSLSLMDAFWQFNLLDIVGTVLLSSKVKLSHGREAELLSIVRKSKPW